MTRTDDELVVLAATLVMRWKPVPCYGPYGHIVGYLFDNSGGRNYTVAAEGYDRQLHWNPLSSIADAWMLVQAVRERGWSTLIFEPESRFRPYKKLNLWAVCFTKPPKSIDVKDASDSRAITLAAIAAMETIREP